MPIMLGEKFSCHPREFEDETRSHSNLWWTARIAIWYQAQAEAEQETN